MKDFKDKNGHVLEKGDHVMLEGTVVDFDESDDSVLVKDATGEETYVPAASMMKRAMGNTAPPNEREADGINEKPLHPTVPVGAPSVDDEG